MAALIDCLTGGGSVLRGDSGAMAWAIAALYGLAALVCLAAARHAGNRDLARFWAYLALALMLLGLNKQLDLQTSLTAYGKCLSVRQGWYDHRRLAQGAFLVLTLAAGIWVTGRMLHLAWPHRAALRLALAGMFGLALFVAARAMGMYHLDALLGARPDPEALRNPLEIAALAAILANGLLALRQRHGAGRGEN